MLSLCDLLAVVLVAAVAGAVVSPAQTQPRCNAARPCNPPRLSHDICIVGAGPGGLQLASLLQDADRDYIVLERENTPGTFFRKFPRHRRLISINKRFTGKADRTFNERHDWNSLLSDDDDLLFAKFSDEYFPHADALVRYFEAFAKRRGLKIKFGHTVESVRRVLTADGSGGDSSSSSSSSSNSNSSSGSRHGQGRQARDQRTALESRFALEVRTGGGDDDDDDDDGRVHVLCGVVVMATGLVPNVPEIDGIELTEGYEDLPTHPEAFVNQTVLILGAGNAALETASAVHETAASVQVLSTRGRRIRLAWETHYPGDLRISNNALLEAYQLKSLDTVRESRLSKLRLIQRPCQEAMLDGPVCIALLGTDVSPFQSPEMVEIQHSIFRDVNYDRVIRCLGWRYDSIPLLGKGEQSEASSSSTTSWSSSSASSASTSSSTSSATSPASSPVGLHYHQGDVRTRRLRLGGDDDSRKFPSISGEFESEFEEGLFFAGAIAHSLDYRKAAGGFIHGFRYTARALFRGLEERLYGIEWPGESLTLSTSKHPAKGKLPARSKEKGAHNNDQQQQEHTLAGFLLDRINSMAGPYQMFSFLADVYVLRQSSPSPSPSSSSSSSPSSPSSSSSSLSSYRVTRYQEIPLPAVEAFMRRFQRDECLGMLTVQFVYGAEFSKPGADVFAHDRAKAPSDSEQGPGAHHNFIHPYIQFHACTRPPPPTPAEPGTGNGPPRALSPAEQLDLEIDFDIDPALAAALGLKSDDDDDEGDDDDGFQLLLAAEHHMIESLDTSWRLPLSHVEPLRRFLAACLRQVVH